MIIDNLICPICGAKLGFFDKFLECGNRHRFDFAKQGYVNLLPVNRKHSKNPGDTREMVRARQEFLAKGYYEPIAETAVELLTSSLPEMPLIVDAGCGEGYYLSYIRNRISGTFIGFDISKEAVRFASARNKGVLWLTASSAAIPIADEAADAVTSMFALTKPEEFSRILKSNGYFLEITAGRKHLMNLKSLIYPKLILKQEKDYAVPTGFREVVSRTISFEIQLDDSETIMQLLTMTPHYWRITKNAAERLAGQNTLHDRTEVEFRLFQKIADSCSV